MVTFRFYLVSVIAFFLALAVGVVVGSVLDGRISDSLKDRLGRVESNLDSTIDLIDQKNDEISDLKKYANASIPFAVEGRLEGTSTLVVAQSGLDTDQVADIVAALRQGGAAAPGVVWIDKSWDPRSAEFLTRVHNADESIKPAAGTVEQRIWVAVLRSLNATPEPSELPEEPTTAPTPSSETTEPAQPQDEEPSDDPTVLPASSWWDQPLLVQFAEQSVIRLQAIGGNDSALGGTLNVVIVMGPDSEVRGGNSEVGTLARASMDAGIPTVVAEVSSSSSHSSDGDSTLKPLLERYQLAKASSVQRADEVAGRVAVVLALQGAANGEYGNYGSGRQASSLLPAGG